MACKLFDYFSLAWQTRHFSKFLLPVCLFKNTASSTDIPSPEIVAAQGALVAVGSSYVTYIDKKGQVRCLWKFTKKKKLLDKIMRAC